MAAMGAVAAAPRHAPPHRDRGQARSYRDSAAAVRAIAVGAALAAMGAVATAPGMRRRTGIAGEPAPTGAAPPRCVPSP